MATDNRYQRNDCENNTGWAGDDTANNISTAGSFIEGTQALSTQLSNADERMSTTQDTTAAGTFSVDFSDRTVYANIKDNLGNTYANNGVQIVIGDGTDEIGYSVAGNDARGMPQQLFFTAFKLDCSESDTTAGNHAVYAGSEANLTYTAITQIGYGSNHLAKAVGSVDNVLMDGFYDIANGSYALTIDGGTVGTPETMADVLSDDETNGWGMVTNPQGSSYVIFAPTEWGTPSGTANSYFTATNEQWFLLGDNAGGRAIGATHFPMRLVGNGTGTNSFVLTNVVVVNTGAGSEFDCSNTDMDIVEINLCTFDGLASFDAPVAGTSDFVTNCIFVNCGLVTGNEADFSGSSFITPTVAADGAAINWNETISTAHTISELDNTTFEMGTNNHHAISFPTTVSNGADITLTGLALDGFDADGTGDSDNSMFEFLAATGTITLNLVSCTVDGGAATDANVTVDERAGCTVNIVIDPVVTKFTVQDEMDDPIQNARVFTETSDNGGGSGFPYQASTTNLTQAAGTATCDTTANHLLATNDYVVIRGAQPDGYNKVAQITVTDPNTFTYTVGAGLSSPATGTPIVSYVPVTGLTDVNGEISSSKTWPASQGITGWARKGNAVSPFYSQANMTVADASLGTDQLATLGTDE